MHVNVYEIHFYFLDIPSTLVLVFLPNRVWHKPFVLPTNTIVFGEVSVVCDESENKPVFQVK